MHAIRGSVLLMALLSPAIAGAAQFDAARERIHDAMREDNLPSIAVGVAHRGRIVWEEGFGYANQEKRRPATAHTVYSLASLSKPFTATAMMIQVERGKLDLDRSINDYLGEAKVVAHVGDARDATLRRLANHTSGLPMHYRFFYEDEAAARPSMDESIRRYGHLMAAPGESYNYSNFGFGLIEYAIERSSGRSYADFIRHEVFEPLGLRHSTVNREPDLGDEVAVRYARDGSVLPFYDFDHRGASAVFASVHDMLRFGMFHLKDRLPEQRPILADRTIEQMWVASADDAEVPDGKGRRGIGWALLDIYDLDRVGHLGDMAGVSARFSLFPQHDLAVILVANAADARLQPIEAAIVHELLPQTRGAEHAGQIDAALVGTWHGNIDTYAGKVPVELVVGSNGRVQIHIGTDGAVAADDVAIGADGELQLNAVRAQIPTDDARRHPHLSYFKLKLRGEILGGSATAIARPLAGRVGDALPYWIELRRAPMAPADPVTRE